MKDYCITLRITKPDLSFYKIKFNDAIVIKREDGILVKHMTCNGELLAYYPLTWVIEVIKVDVKENN